jgi:hypothetical protein
LISYFIDTNWRDPHGSQPYALFVDQNALVYSKSYYQPNAWPNTETNYRNYITQLIMTLANVSNVQLDANTLANDVTGNCSYFCLRVAQVQFRLNAYVTTVVLRRIPADDYYDRQAGFDLIAIDIELSR